MKRSSGKRRWGVRLGGHDGFVEADDLRSEARGVEKMTGRWCFEKKVEESAIEGALKNWLMLTMPLQLR